MNNIVGARKVKPLCQVVTRIKLIHLMKNPFCCGCISYIYFDIYYDIFVGDDAEWQKADPNDPGQNWANITGLGHGDLYEVRLVAVNGRGVETRSKPRRVRIGPHQGKLKEGLFILCLL